MSAIDLRVFIITEADQGLREVVVMEDIPVDLLPVKDSIERLMIGHELSGPEIEEIAYVLDEFYVGVSNKENGEDPHDQIADETGCDDIFMTFGAEVEERNLNLFVFYASDEEAGERLEAQFAETFKGFPPPND